MLPSLLRVERYSNPKLVPEREEEPPLGDILGISPHTDADSGTQKTKRAGAVKP
jgi:hypothetical protein